MSHNPNLWQLRQQYKNPRVALAKAREAYGLPPPKGFEPTAEDIAEAEKAVGHPIAFKHYTLPPR